MRNSMFLILILLSALFSFGVLALGLEEPLPNAAQEERARALFQEFRCVVCQGESVADSPADVASDMRRTIRAQIADGKSDEDITAYLVSRYGEGVLMRPPLYSAPLLWLLPFLLLGGMGIAAYFFFRRAP